VSELLMVPVSLTAVEFGILKATINLAIADVSVHKHLAMLRPIVQAVGKKLKDGSIALMGGSLSQQQVCDMLTVEIRKLNSGAELDQRTTAVLFGALDLTILFKSMHLMNSIFGCLDFCGESVLEHQWRALVKKLEQACDSWEALAVRRSESPVDATSDLRAMSCLSWVLPSVPGLQ